MKKEVCEGTIFDNINGTRCIVDKQNKYIVLRNIFDKYLNKKVKIIIKSEE